MRLGDAIVGGRGAAHESMFSDRVMTFRHLRESPNSGGASRAGPGGGAHTRDGAAGRADARRLRVCHTRVRVGGPSAFGQLLTGSHRSERVGACTDCRRYWGRFRADEIDEQEVAAVNNQLVASVGTCSVMGTASTMACLAHDQLYL